MIRFDEIIGDQPGQVPPGSKIISARLRTASTTSNAQGDGGPFHPMLIDWSDTDTFNSLTDGVSTDGSEALEQFRTAAGNASRSPDVQAGFHDWDVTADLQDWVSGVRENYGWFIDHWEGGSNGFGFQSSDAATESERPRLEIYYTEATNSAPTDIVLSNDTVAENTDTTGGLTVGTLSAEDPDTADTHTFELIAGAGDADNELFSIDGDTLSINDGQDLDFETKSSYAIRVRTVDSGGLPLERQLTVNVGDLLEVSDIVVGDGTAQRSRVEQVTVEFDGEVQLDDGAFAVNKRGGDGGAVDVAVSTQLVGGSTVATLQFSGGFTQFGSLSDGNYDLTVDGTKISRPGGELLDANQDGTGGGQLLFGDDAVDNFFRLYGDADGDGDTDITDLNDSFVPAFGSLSGQAAYRPELDADNDGDVDITDLNDHFVPNFGALRPKL